MIEVIHSARCNLCPWSQGFRNLEEVPEICPDCGNDPEKGKALWKKRHDDNFFDEEYS